MWLIWCFIFKKQSWTKIQSYMLPAQDVVLCQLACCSVTKSCQTLPDSVHEVLQARILEWVAISRCLATSFKIQLITRHCEAAIITISHRRKLESPQPTPKRMYQELKKQVFKPKTAGEIPVPLKQKWLRKEGPHSIRKIIGILPSYDISQDPNLWRWHSGSVLLLKRTELWF